jgi:hypothetical protein
MICILLSAFVGQQIENGQNKLTEGLNLLKNKEQLFSIKQGRFQSS